MKAKYSNFKNKQLHQVKENAAQSQHYNAQSKRPRPRKAKKKMNCSRGIETILDGVHVFHIYLVSFFKKIFLTNITSC